VLVADDVVFDALHNQAYRNPSWYSSFCGSHTYGKDDVLQASGGSSSYRDIYVFYPTAKTNLNCIPSAMKKSPNDDPGLDAVMNVLAHELIETTSGYDIGNQCVYQFGNIKIDSKGKQYTETMGSYNYFIQQNYNYKTQTCMNG